MRKLVYKALTSRHKWKSTQWDYWCLHSTVVDGVLQEYFTRRSLELSPSFECKWGAVVKAKGDRAKSREWPFFSFSFLWPGEAVPCSRLHLTIGWDLPVCSENSHPFLGVDKIPPAPLLPIQLTSVLQEDLVMEKQETHVAKRERITGNESSPAWDELSQQRMIEALNLHWDIQEN